MAAAVEIAATGSTWAHWQGDQKTHASAAAELAKVKAPFGKSGKAARQGENRKLWRLSCVGHLFEGDHQIAYKGGIAPEELPCPTAPGKARRVAVSFVFKPCVRSSSERCHCPYPPCWKPGIVMAADLPKTDGMSKARASPVRGANVSYPSRLPGPAPERVECRSALRPAACWRPGQTAQALGSRKSRRQTAAANPARSQRLDW